MGKLRVTLACWDYDRTSALANGTVVADGLDINYLSLPVEETFFRMLRNKESTSTLEDLAKGSFMPVIPETDDDIDPAKVKQIVFCAGKIYFELRAARRERKIRDIAIVRLEQMYPFPHAAFKAEMERYAKAATIVWCQEAPRNQGAWHRIQHYLAQHLRPDQKLRDALRPSSASPAVGYASMHAEQQRAVIDAALTL